MSCTYKQSRSRSQLFLSKFIIVNCSLGANGDELTVAELYKRTSQEVDSLKERLGKRCGSINYIIRQSTNYLFWRILFTPKISPGIFSPTGEDINIGIASNQSCPLGGGGT